MLAKIIYPTVLLLFGLLSISCTNHNNTEIETGKYKQLALQLASLDDINVSIISNVGLDADGHNKGLTAYELIRRFGGKGSIESPDLYASNHPEQQHSQQHMTRGRHQRIAYAK